MNRQQRTDELAKAFAAAINETTDKLVHEMLNDASVEGIEMIVHTESWAGEEGAVTTTLTIQTKDNRPCIDDCPIDDPQHDMMAHIATIDGVTAVVTETTDPMLNNMKAALDTIRLLSAMDL